MFKKLVSNLPFSPSLVGQLGFYAQRLKKEEWIRRLGLIFTVFALIIQSLAIFMPPESANASDTNDMCPGVSRDAAGAKKIKACYDKNTNHFKDVMNFFGISKTELWKSLDAGGSWRYTTTYKSWYTFGHVKRFSGDKDFSGQVPGNLFARKWSSTIQTRQWGWKGSQGDTQFIILADCGNLALKRLLSPSAKCVSLSASKREITAGDSVTLTAKASTEDGAEISKFDFKQNGPVNANKSVSTNAESATWQQTLTKAGKYTFTVDIDTTNNKDNITAKTCTAEVTVSEKQVVPPEASCDLLTIAPEQGVLGTTFKVTAKASTKNGAVINRYNFTAGGAQNHSWISTTNAGSSIWSLTPSVAGNYNVSVSVDTSIGAKTSPACNKSFSVSEPASAECKLLSVEQVSRTEYKLNATGSVANGASITGYSYVIKDSSGNIVKKSGVIADSSWSVTLPDNNSVSDSAVYSAILTIHTNLGDQSSADCEKPIVIPPQEQCKYNPELPVNDPNCKSDCETNPEGENCKPELDLVKTAINKSQGDKDAVATNANGGDVILYTITLTNNGNAAGKIELRDIIGDTMEYATLTDAGGANYDENAHVLSWGEVAVGANSTVTRNFAVTVKNPVPSMAQNHGSPESFDCIMTNVIREDGQGAIHIPVTCPTVKTVEQVVSQLPATGPGDNILFGGIIAAVVVFFYARSRQLGKEVRLVRREFNAGSL